MHDPVTIVITRPEPEGEGFEAACRARFGAELSILRSALIEIVFLDQPALDLNDRVPIFTSKNGVRAVERWRGREGGLAFVVGSATADLAKNCGFDPVSADGDSEGLVRLIQEIAPDKPLLHVRGEHVTGDVTAKLGDAGFNISEVVAYKQIAQSPGPKVRAVLGVEGTVIFPVFSVRTAQILASELADAVAETRAVAISSAVAEHIAGSVDVIGTAARPTSDAVLDEIGRLLAG